MSGNPPVAVVTAATARRFWPDQNAVGKHIRFVGEKDWRTVVGVIADVRAYDLERNLPEWIKGTVYVPFSPRATLEDGRIPAEMTIALRTSLDESQAGAMLRRIVSDLNQDVPVSEVKTMGAVVSGAVSTPASTMSLFVAFAGLALILGMVGIYGVLSFLVSKRTREIGIRIALGAQRRNVLWLVMREGARFSLLGIGLGLTGAFLRDAISVERTLRRQPDGSGHLPGCGRRDGRSHHAGLLFARAPGHARRSFDCAAL